MSIIEYSSKQTAVRGFIRATKNLADPQEYVFQQPNGKWGFENDLIEEIIRKEEEATPLEEMIEQVQAHNEAKEAVVEALNAAPYPVPEYEPVAAPDPIKRRSDFTGAIAYCHAQFDANPDLRRGEAIKLCVAGGIAYYTARTQYQKWSTARKTTRLA